MKRVCDYCQKPIRHPKLYDGSPVNYHEGRADCDLQASTDIKERLFALVAVSALLIVIYMTFWAASAFGAPAPAVVAPKAPAGKFRPITDDDLYKVKTLYWGKKEWAIGFQKDGHYWCSSEVNKEGGRMLWFGPWRLDGGDVVLDECCSWVTPDSPPTPGSSIEYRLELRVEDGKIVGKGWGSDLRLE